MATEQRAGAPAGGVTDRALTMLGEFKAFALKGNVIDLAIGVIIGGAFGKIIDSLVKHIIMPLIAVVLPGEKGYLGWKVTIGGSEVPFGLFIGEVINFLIIALALFLFLQKFLGWVLRQKQQQEMASSPSLTKDQELLAEIRDLLRQQAGPPPGAGTTDAPPSRPAV